MKFSFLLLEAIRGSEIPLRFEPGAEEAIAKPITELLRAWLRGHEPRQPDTAFDLGRKALIAQLLEELEDARDIVA